MSQKLAVIGTFKLGDLSLVDCLGELEKYGKPRLSKFHDGWHCGIEVFVTGEGTEFKVRSDYNHATHKGAANLCLIRLMTELKRIKDT